MDNKEQFEEWVILKQKRSESTAYKYSRAIVTIMNELYEETGIRYDFYKMSNISDVERGLKHYLLIPKFSEKDERGNRMYSCALRKYIEFMKEDRGL